MKKTTALLLACVLSASTLSACSPAPSGSSAPAQSTPASTEPSDAPSSQTTGEQVELRFSWWGAEARHNQTLAAIDAYEAKNPNVKFVPEYSGYTGYQDKLTAQIAAGNAPDVFAGVSEWIPQQTANDALLDLTGKIDVSGQNAMIVKSCSQGDKLYSVNLAVNAPTYVYNKRILDEIGVELPKEGYTWDDFAAKCKEIAEKSNGSYYGSVDSSVVYHQFQAFGYSKLGKTEAFPYDNEKLTVTAEDVTAYYQFWKDLRDAGAVAPPEMSVTSVDNSLCTRGVAVFVPVWSATFPQFQNETQDELGMIPMPQGPNGERPESSRPGITLSVFSKSAHPEESIKFIDYFANDTEVAKILTTSYGVLPTEAQRKAVMDAGDLLTATDKKVIEITDKCMSGDIKLFYPGPNGISQVFGGGGDALEKIGQEVAFDKTNINDAGEKFMAEAQRLLDSSK